MQIGRDHVEDHLGKEGLGLRRGSRGSRFKVSVVFPLSVFADSLVARRIGWGAGVGLVRGAAARGE